MQWDHPVDRALPEQQARQELQGPSEHPVKWDHPVQWALPEQEARQGPKDRRDHPADWVGRLGRWDRLVVRTPLGQKDLQGLRDHRGRRVSDRNGSRLLTRMWLRL